MQGKFDESLALLKQVVKESEVKNPELAASVCGQVSINFLLSLHSVLQIIYTYRKAAERFSDFKLEDSIPWAEKSLSLLTPQFGLNHVIVRNVCLSLSDVHRRLGDLEVCPASCLSSQH